MRIGTGTANKSRPKNEDRGFVKHILLNDFGCGRDAVGYYFPDCCVRFLGRWPGPILLIRGRLPLVVCHAFSGRRKASGRPHLLSSRNVASQHL